MANGTIDAITASGSLVLTVSNCTFTSNGLGDILTNPTGTAAYNVTVQGCNMSNAPAPRINFELGANTTGAVGLNLLNNAMTGNSQTQNGIRITTQGTTQLTARILNNTISGCTNEGLFAAISGTSLAKMRFEGNRTTGNAANNGWTNASSVASTLQAIYRNNTSDRFNLNRGAGTTYQVEELANFNTTSGNTGFVSPVGGVQDVPAGSLNIP